MINFFKTFFFSGVGFILLNFEMHFPGKTLFIENRDIPLKITDNSMVISLSLSQILVWYLFSHILWV